MRKLSVIGIVFTVAVTAMLVAGTAWAKKPTPPPPPGGCNCADIYSPVICSNGVVYSNLCQANCAKASGCVPYNDAAMTASTCRCPLIYAPVICDKGRTYPNQCVADCRNAQNCKPTGEL